MLKETARVINIDDRFAWLQAERKTACGSCQASKGCGVSLVDSIFKPAPATIRVQHNNIVEKGELAQGDRVEIGLDEAAFLRSSLLVYLLPILSMLGFAIVPGLLRYNEGVVMICALSGLMAGLCAVFLFSKKLAANANYQAVLIRKIEN